MYLDQRAAFDVSEISSVALGSFASGVALLIIRFPSGHITELANKL
ncbi:MAG: hypothetical protein ACO38Q_05220 [Aquiluna sp.]